MEGTWKILIIVVIGTIVAGLIAGVCVGKFLVKRAKSGRRRFLSTKERIVYSVCVVLGAALILFGAIYKFPSPGGAVSDDTVTMDEPAGAGGYVNRGGGVAVARRM